MPDVLMADGLSPGGLVVVVSAAAFLGLVTFAGIRDVVSYIIPNWISLAIAGAFAVAAVASGMAWAAVGWHVLASVMVFTVGAILFHYGAMGGGDVKLMTAAALWTGLSGGVVLVLLVSLYGGVLTLIVLAGRLIRGAAAGAAKGADGTESPGVPYGAAIAAGVLTIFLGFPAFSGDLLKSAAIIAAGVGG